MKKNNFRTHALLWIILVIILIVGSTTRLLAQTESTEKKQRARISLDFYSTNNEEKKLVATVKTKVDGFYQNVSGVEIHFFKTLISSENLLGVAKTDVNGKAVLILSEDADTALWFTYTAVLENNPKFRDTDKEIEVIKGYMEMDLEEIDSLKTIKIFVGAPDSTGNVTPAEEVNVGVYVERLFGLLPISDEFGSTDEEGVLNIEFPSDIPGDENGNITIVAQVSDHDEFGNLESRKSTHWGVPIKLDKSELDKELWLSSSNTPKVFVGIVNSVLIGVLGVIVYIVFQLIQIWKLGLKESSSKD